MNVFDLQRWLNEHGQTVVVDGLAGPMTRTAILNVFSNDCGAAVSDHDIAVLATRLGCTAKQIKAVAKVESGGAAYDSHGRPKILFERHIFYRLTAGKFPITSFNQSKGGGYDQDSWDKLTRAAAFDVDAAFASASWGKFQVLGSHWRALGYASPLEMAYSTVTGEAAHYEMLARYVDYFGLEQAIRQLSTNPADNEMFARLYNGPAFRKFSYDKKLAAAMA
jgi:hypothetical protein